MSKSRNTSESADAIAGLTSEKASLDSPSLTGVPTAPTAPLGADTTQLATTAFVAAAVPTRQFLSILGANWGVTLGSPGSLTVPLDGGFVVQSGISLSGSNVTLSESGVYLLQFALNHAQVAHNVKFYIYEDGVNSAHSWNQQFMPNGAHGTWSTVTTMFVADAAKTYSFVGGQGGMDTAVSLYTYNFYMCKLAS